MAATNKPGLLIIRGKGNSPAQRVELRNFRICFLSLTKVSLYLRKPNNLLLFFVISLFSVVVAATIGGT